MTSSASRALLLCAPSAEVAADNAMSERARTIVERTGTPLFEVRDTEYSPFTLGARATGVLADPSRTCQRVVFRPAPYESSEVALDAAGMVERPLDA